MLRCLPRSTAAFALLVACASDPAGPPAPDASAADVSADAPAADGSAPIDGSTPRARLEGVSGNWGGAPVNASDLAGTAVFAQLRASALRGWEESSLHQYTRELGTGSSCGVRSALPHCALCPQRS